MADAHGRKERAAACRRPAIAPRPRHERSPDRAHRLHARHARAAGRDGAHPRDHLVEAALLHPGLRGRPGHPRPADGAPSPDRHRRSRRSVEGGRSMTCEPSPAADARAPPCAGRGKRMPALSLQRPARRPLLAHRRYRGQSRALALRPALRPRQRQGRRRQMDRRRHGRAWRSARPHPRAPRP